MYIPPDLPTQNLYDANQADPIDSEPILIQGPSTSEPPIDTNMNLADAPQDDNRRHGKQRKALAKKNSADDEPGSSEKAGQPRRSGRRG